MIDTREKTQFANVLAITGALLLATALHGVAWFVPLTSDRSTPAPDPEPKPDPKPGPVPKPEPEEKSATSTILTDVVIVNEQGKPSETAGNDGAVGDSRGAPRRDGPPPQATTDAVPDAAAALAPSTATVSIDTVDSPTEKAGTTPGSGRPGPALVLSWPSLADVRLAVDRWGLGIAGVRSDKIVCAVHLAPTLRIEPWRSGLGEFSPRAREIPPSLLQPFLGEHGLDAVWVLIPNAIAQRLEAQLAAELARRGLALEAAGAIYARFATQPTGDVVLSIDSVVPRRGT